MQISKLSPNNSYEQLILIEIIKTTFTTSLL